MKQDDSLIIKGLWILHLAIVLMVYIFFLIPEKMFPLVQEFHFAYLLLIVFSEAVWGHFMKQYSGKFALVCPLTTIMQSLRGFKISDKRNYGHSFVVEFLEHFEIKTKFNVISFLLLATVCVVIIRLII